MAGRLPSYPELPAPRLARAITVVALCCYASVTVLNVLRAEDPQPVRLMVCLALVLLVFGVQFVVSAPRARTWSLGRKLSVLGFQVMLTYLPMAWFGLSWGSMEGPLAATVLLSLPARFAWPLYGVVVSSIPVYSAIIGVPLAEVGYFLIAGLLAGLVIYGLSRLTDLVHEVHAAREELARMAVNQERLRFARDLHDLLGYSLSAVTLKGELIHRLIAARPEQARAETTELLEVARQALADVRLVSSGYRDMCLRDEAASAASILAAADIEAVVDIDCGPLHPVADTVLATALREGVTNILRHSKVQNCTIRAARKGETVLLTLVNDGAHTSGKGSGGPSGSGLGNLRERLRAIGGNLTAGIRDDGRFHLEALAPATPSGTLGHGKEAVRGTPAVSPS
ncbi:histidine kinase [Streptomyces ferrugineus]|uniref:Histidine kinase n=1 Tax=Streptomyces ferrugineus TaxID=1413221 RepID=A0A7M2SJQ9_9ACTN|nr:histidine kinase [Streptomyces ferrugineus]QOV35703.1 histidine kinase [Streptomyces ferrugineus]